MKENMLIIRSNDLSFVNKLLAKCQIISGKINENGEGKVEFKFNKDYEGKLEINEKKGEFSFQIDYDFITDEIFFSGSSWKREPLGKIIELFYDEVNSGRTYLFKFIFNDALIETIREDFSFLTRIAQTLSYPFKYINTEEKKCGIKTEANNSKFQLLYDSEGTFMLSYIIKGYDSSDTFNPFDPIHNTSKEKIEKVFVYALVSELNEEKKNERKEEEEKERKAKEEEKERKAKEKELQGKVFIVGDAQKVVILRSEGKEAREKIERLWEKKTFERLDSAISEIKPISKRDYAGFEILFKNKIHLIFNEDLTYQKRLKKYENEGEYGDRYRNDEEPEDCSDYKIEIPLQSLRKLILNDSSVFLEILGCKIADPHRTLSFEGKPLNLTIEGKYRKGTNMKGFIEHFKLKPLGKRRSPILATSLIYGKVKLADLSLDSSTLKITLYFYADKDLLKQLSNIMDSLRDFVHFEEHIKLE